MQKLLERGAPLACDLCGTNNWVLGNNYYYLPAQSKIREINVTAETGMPVAALVCKNCGNTAFINLILLGLGDLFLGEEKENGTEK